MYSQNVIVCALVAAAGTSASSAGVFTWIGGTSGSWNDPANWAGPGGLYPRLVGDTVTISGSLDSATLDSNTALGHLNVLDGAAVYSGGNSLFVDGDVNLIGTSSSVSVTDTPALRDFDADNLLISGGVLAMYGGLAQIDESLTIDSPSGGAVLGVGTIEMNSTTGNLIVGKGGLWALGGSGPATTLFIDRTDSSTSRLDMSHPDADIIVWDGKTVHNKLPYTGALGGKISVSNANGSSRFISDEGFIAAPSSQISFGGIDQVETSRIDAPFVDSYGEINAYGKGRLVSPFVGLRGSGTIGKNAELAIDSAAMLWDSFTFTAAGPGAEIRFPQISSAVAVTGGTTVFDLGEDGEFDLDGGGFMEINIADGSSLEIYAGRLDTSSPEVFSGTLNVAGHFHAESYGPGQPRWASSGEINMDSGEITGRRFENTGTLSGRGTIGATVFNDGLVEAVDGTLFFDYLDFDGSDSDALSVVRAVQGDIVITVQDSGAFVPSKAKIYVGNGEGVQEVFEMNTGLTVWRDETAEGLLSRNSGFARFGRARISSAFESTGDSVITISGAGDHNEFEFFSGPATVNGDLEIRGNTRVWDDAQVAGNGMINSASTIKRFTLMDGASTGDVGLEIAGTFELGSQSEIDARAATGELTLQPTASFNIDVANDAASGEFDALQIAGDAELDGTLVVRWSTELGEAPVGETYTVLTADSVTGSFDDVDSSNLGVNRRAHVTVLPDSVEVLVTCLTDLNADGILDLADITIFVQDFQAGCD